MQKQASRPSTCHNSILRCQPPIKVHMCIYACKMDAFSDFDMIVLKASKQNKRNISRKKTQLNIKIGESYPPEGHCSIKDSETEEQVRIFCFGGARRGEDSSWIESSNILEFILKVDDDNAIISSIMPCKTKGGTLPPLQSAAVIEYNGRFLVWGGLDLAHYECRDDLIILEKMEGTSQGRATPSTTFDVTYVQTRKNMVPSRRGAILDEQTGTVPQARTGHSLTQLGNTTNAILFGGVIYERQERGFTLQWEKSCQDGRFYVLDMETLSWSLIKVPSTQARAYHSANCIEKDGTLVLVIVGGLTFNKGSSMMAKNREPIHEVLVLTMNLDFVNPILQTVTLGAGSAQTSPVYLSYHATSVVGNSILVYGGFQQESSAVNQNIASTRVYQLDIESRLYCLLSKTAKHAKHSVFATAGHTLINTNNDFVCIGGTSKQISILSDRNFEEDNCDLATCHIQDAEDTEIGWIHCEAPRCGKWFHEFCLGLKRIPAKYYCSACKKIGHRDE
ncbi:uncharacterized protein LOC121426054 [Lytechinus variegatus]|uniref:uncharacterized protein LOC121426054 n=1 Tax=Lytechinus variegatus TaxID=7654 RepID=UPI001BB20989|nr:uncharacterized protein LOC121426054 [Lytechinus variegatus]